MLLARSMATTVLGREAVSSGSWNQPSSDASRAHFSNRPSGLMGEPRPLATPPWLPAVVFRGMAKV